MTALRPLPLPAALARALLSTALLAGGAHAASPASAPAAASAPAHARAPARLARAGSSNSFTIDFPSIDVDAAARAMATILDRPILVDTKAKGTLTMFSDQPVSRAQAFGLFQSALRGTGNALVESNGLLKVVPEAEAKLQTGVVRVETTPQHGDVVETQVFRLANESATNLVAVLRPLISANNTINANSGNNTLVITDYASNLQRLGELIAALDTPSATDVEVIPLEHAMASDLAGLVQKLSDPSAANTGTGSGTGGTAGGGNGGAAQGGATSVSANGVAVIADPHTNALLVKGATPARLAAIRALVARMDRPGAARSNIHVVYLKYTDATRLATVLRAAFAADPAKNSGSGGGSSGGTADAVNKLASAVSSTSSSSSSSSGDTASQQSTAAVTGAGAPSIGGYIQADPASNSLIITAAEPQYRELRATIAELDVRRAQLVVESAVVEVDASKALEAGIQWQSIFNISSTTSLTLGTVVEAIEATSGTNILSTANLVTLDNEEAKIVVGQNVPFVTGSFTSSSSSSSNPFTTVERKDVGITLRLRPQIGTDGTIRLTIYQESSSVASTAATGTESYGPTVNKRAIETNVVVDDGKIIVLGGLIEDSYTTDHERIPVLADIPYLGALFRNVSKTRKRTNLLVFLRPVIVRDQGRADALTLDRYDYIRANQAQIQDGVPETLPGQAGVALPADPKAAWRPAAEAAAAPGARP
jgi:general secretion pathway protein D